MFKLGLIVNPLAGIGGPAALKGSDHKDTLKKALKLGVTPKSQDRAKEMMMAIRHLSADIQLYTASSAMGAEVCAEFPEFQSTVVYLAPSDTQGDDTQKAASALKEAGVDLLVFVGGDGTARDVFNAVSTNQSVIGLPAGVKMHSAVFAVTPRAVASIIQSLLEHKLVSARMAEVRDIDEQAFSQGIVKTRYYGEMLIPDDQLLVQSIKCSGLLDDELMLEELCVYLAETMEDDVLYVLGSGGTLKRLKEQLGIASPTLLGVDVWYDDQLLHADIHEEKLFELVSTYSKVKIILSVIGGQGVVLGRGNQQISSRIIEQTGIDALQFISTQQKLLALNGRALTVDSGSDALNQKLAGFHKIICGYEDSVLYEITYV